MPHPEFEYPIEISEEAGVRSLHFGSDWVQGAMRIRRPYALELAYTREMMACLLLRQDSGETSTSTSASEWPRRVLLIGLGTASLVKFIQRNLPATHMTIVEIDERIVSVAQLHFKLEFDPRRMKLVIADGYEFIQQIQQAKGKYDAIFVDGFGEDGRAGNLDTLTFYQACRERLSKTGLMICNLLGRSRGFHASVERIRKSYDHRAIVFPSLDSGNAIAFAATGDAIDVSLQEMRLHAKKLKADTGLDLRLTISRLEHSGQFPDNRLRL